MFQTQINVLFRTGQQHLEAAASTPDAKIATQRTELGLKCFQEARTIAHSMRQNSILLYAECAAVVNKAPTDYRAYVEFCGLNRCDVVDESTFTEIIRTILKPEPVSKRPKK
jgi:hypothetical protein